MLEHGDSWVGVMSEIDAASIMSEMPNLVGFLIATTLLYRALMRSIELAERLSSELIACYKSRATDD